MTDTEDPKSFRLHRGRRGWLDLLFIAIGVVLVFIAAPWARSVVPKYGLPSPAIGDLQLYCYLAAAPILLVTLVLRDTSRWLRYGLAIPAWIVQGYLFFIALSQPQTTSKQLSSVVFAAFLVWAGTVGLPRMLLSLLAGAFRLWRHERASASAGHAADE